MIIAYAVKAIQFRLASLAAQPMHPLTLCTDSPTFIM